MERFEPEVTVTSVDTALVIWTALTESALTHGERATLAAINGNTLAVSLLSQQRAELQRVAEVVWDEYLRLRSVSTVETAVQLP